MAQVYCETDPVSGRWTGVGRLLTAFEVDDNFYTLIQRVVTLEGSAHTTVSIDYITMSGQNITFHMTDHTTRGPFTVPIATFRDRGTWQPITAYLVNDVFQINGSCFLVLFPHTSAASFDPNANDGMGHNYYLTMLTIPGNSLPAGGAGHMVLTKIDGHDYNVTWSYPIPTGGTTGQILYKTSNTDFAMGWESLSGLGFVSAPPPSPAGTPGQFLATVDGTPSNMEWVSSGGGGGSLATLTDVTITSAQQYDLLEFDNGSSKWINKQRGEVDLGTTSGSHAIDPTTGSVFKITPNGAVTITNPGNAVPGQRCVFKVLTSGTTSYQVSFPTGFSVSGDLFTGVVNNKVYTIDFVMDFSGTLCEVGRSKPVPEVVALGTTGTVSLDPTVGHEVFTIVPSGAITLNAASAPVGKRATLIVTTSGTSSFNITPTTNFKSTGALATGTVSGKVFTIAFIGDGTNMVEVSRTTAM
jgi:hypothetical protein